MERSEISRFQLPYTWGDSWPLHPTATARGTCIAGERAVPLVSGRDTVFYIESVRADIAFMRYAKPCSGSSVDYSYGVVEERYDRRR